MQDQTEQMIALVRYLDGALWSPIETAPRAGLMLGIVRGKVRLIHWGKTSHVPLYGWNLADQGPEDWDLCDPTHWMPLPGVPK